MRWSLGLGTAFLGKLVAQGAFLHTFRLCNSVAFVGEASNPGPGVKRRRRVVASGSDTEIDPECGRVSSCRFVGGSSRSKFNEVGAHWWFSGHHSRRTVECGSAPRTIQRGRRGEIFANSEVAPAHDVLELLFLPALMMSLPTPKGSVAMGPVRPSAASQEDVAPPSKRWTN